MALAAPYFAFSSACAVHFFNMSNEEFAVYKIAVIGDVFVGKTSLIQRFVKNPKDCDKTKATIAYDFNEVSVIEDNKRIDLHVFDCSGNQQFREISSCVYENVKGIIFVYDVSNRESFTNLQHSWLKVADDFMEADNHCPIFVVANKIDLPKEKRVVEKEEGEQFATAQSASSFLETSAVAGLGIEKLFRDVAKTMVTTWGGLHASMSSEARQSIQVAQKEKKKRFKQLRRLVSCFRPCCCCKSKHKKTETTKSPKEYPTPMPSLTHEGKTIVTEEEVNADAKDSEGPDEETKLLKNEAEEGAKADAKDSEAPDEETKLFKNEAEEGVKADAKDSEAPDEETKSLKNEEKT